MAGEPVPHSSGIAPPKLKAPEGACDCHMHIYDERFSITGPTHRLQKHARVAEYRLLQKRIGTSRTVIVTPGPYRFDNAVTLDAIDRLGLTHARAVAVISPDATAEELKRMHTGGVRGIRFTLFDPSTAVTRFDWIEPLAARVAALGWHTQIHLRGDQIVEHEALLNRLPGTVVIDHMGRLPQPEGLKHPAYGVVRRLIDKGKTWVKLSGAYIDTESGPPDYADILPVARAYVAAAPQRCVWGSDWPHPTEKQKPDDAVLLDLLLAWAPDEAVRNRILVDNPQMLYDFPA